jgi:YidC/Oxa1 family membrane protein insertase
MKDTNQRLFLTIALCLGVALAWGMLFQPKHAPAPGGQAAPQGEGAASRASPSAPAPAPAAQPASPGGAEVPRGTPPPGATRAPTRDLALDSAKVHVVVTTAGGALKSVQLKGPKFLRHTPDGKAAGQVDLVSPGASPLPLATEVRAGNGTGGEAPVIAADAAYEVVRSDAESVVLRTQAGGATLLKTFTLDPARYGLRVSYEIRSKAALSGHLVVVETGHGEESKSGMFSAHAKPKESICQAGGKLERLAVGAKHPTWDGPGAASFAGIDEQYFLRASVVDPKLNATCHIEAQPSGALAARLQIPLSVAAGGSVSQSLTEFMGPKDVDELAAVAPELREAVDFGFWSVIASFLLAVMKFFYKVVPPHNWGVAIILLTVTIKLVTFPLQHRSMKSMQEMQRIQPQLEELKKKYAGDQQRQNLEQMKLFKEHGVNPMGSCLPMVIQMPVWFALYTTLGVSVELYNSIFIPGWLNDLTAPDPYYVLPIAMGITMIATQMLTPTPMSNPSQKIIGYVMSGFFSLIMINLPSGLTLYIFTNNILSIAQQMYLRRSLKLPKPPSSPASGQTVAVSAKRA